VNLRVGHSDRGDVFKTTLRSNHWNPPERERESLFYRSDGKEKKSKKKN